MKHKKRKHKGKKLDTSDSSEDEKRIKSLRKKRKRKYSSSSSSSSSTSSTDSVEERKRAERKLRKKLKKHKTKDNDKTKNQSSNTETVTPQSNDIPIELMNRSMVPMTKEQWEKQQSVVRRVYDESTGRHRLIKGDGEVIEEIVSRDRHKQINKAATSGDGNFFQANVMKKK